MQTRSSSKRKVLSTKVDNIDKNTSTSSPECQILPLRGDNIEEDFSISSAKRQLSSFDVPDNNKGSSSSSISDSYNNATGDVFHLIIPKQDNSDKSSSILTTRKRVVDESNSIPSISTKKKRVVGESNNIPSISTKKKRVEDDDNYVCISDDDCVSLTEDRNKEKPPNEIQNHDKHVSNPYDVEISDDHPASNHEQTTSNSLQPNISLPAKHNQIANNLQPLIASLTQQPNDILTMFMTFAQVVTAASSIIPSIAPSNITNTVSAATPTNLLVNLFIDECKTLFLRIRMPIPQIILTLARSCANHLNVTFNAIDAKKRGRGWFATWRTRLFDDCLEIAFDFMERYGCTPNKLPNEEHIRNYISYDDVVRVFESQLRKVKRDKLAKDRASQNLLKRYITDVVFLMIKHYTTIGITRTRYEKETVTTNDRTAWR
ncbi:unnamed protein product [Rhizophagus irregularis]|nr:unnamed protein product [Rhizophagus irregularis]